MICQLHCYWSPWIFRPSYGPGPGQTRGDLEASLIRKLKNQQVTLEFFFLTSLAQLDRGTSTHWLYRFLEGQKTSRF